MLSILCCPHLGGSVKGSSTVFHLYQGQRPTGRQQPIAIGSTTHNSVLSLTFVSLDTSLSMSDAVMDLLFFSLLTSSHVLCSWEICWSLSTTVWSEGDDMMIGTCLRIPTQTLNDTCPLITCACTQKLTAVTYMYVYLLLSVTVTLQPCTYQNFP